MDHAYEVESASYASSEVLPLQDSPRQTRGVRFAPNCKDYDGRDDSDDEADFKPRGSPLTRADSKKWDHRAPKRKVVQMPLFPRFLGKPVDETEDYDWRYHDLLPLHERPITEFIR